jgi:hypothetical protein
MGYALDILLRSDHDSNDDWSNDQVKLAGCLMLFSGWTIVLAALVLLPSMTLRASFIGAGILVEIIGLGLIARGEVNVQRQDQALKQSISGARTFGAGPGVYR